MCCALFLVGCVVQQLCVAPVACCALRTRCCTLCVVLLAVALRVVRYLPHRCCCVDVLCVRFGGRWPLVASRWLLVDAVVGCVCALAGCCCTVLRVYVALLYVWLCCDGCCWLRCWLSVGVGCCWWPLASVG